MSKFFSRFRTLQWKLTLSYTWVTTAVAIAVFLIVIFVAVYFIGNTIPSVASAFQPVLRPAGPQIAEFLEQAPPDLAGLRAWLDSSQQGNEFQIRNEANNGVSNVRLSELTFVAVVDSQGDLLAIEPGGDITQSVESLLFVEAMPAFERVLQGETDPDRLTAVQAETNLIFVAIPVVDTEEAILGALILVMDLPIAQNEIFTVNTILGLFPLILFVFIVAGFTGTIFGFIASRNLSRRLKRLTETAVSWSEGDFSATVQDNSADEIGQLSQRLSQMAEQLQNMVHTRSELAALEERNRLARDLHDSVKQQVFATAMQLGAAQSTMDKDPATAKRHLQDAEKLTRQAQQELTGLIQELRPAALDGKGLVEALRGYAEDWSRRTGMAAQLTVAGEKPLPLEIEQPLYRVAQEALANVARHSKAQSVIIHLAWHADGVTMSITDDGHGFEVTKAIYGMGLQSMEERLVQLNGRLTINSSQDQGTQLNATVPLPIGDKN